MKAEKDISNGRCYQLEALQIGSDLPTPNHGPYELKLSDTVIYNREESLC